VVVIVLLGALAALVVAAVAVVLLPRGPDHPSQWDPKVVELVEYVEHRRDRDFEHPVHVRFLDEDAYATRITSPGEDVEGGGDDPDAAEADATSVAVMRAFGLLEGELDVQEASDDLVSDGSAAFYDPETDEVLVKGTELTVATRAVLVHELTHALQDQVADLLETTGETGDHAAALHAFAEGDANEVEAAWVAQLGPTELDEYLEEWDAGAEEAEADLDESAVPEAWQVSFGLPYSFGTPFVRKVLDEGGNAELWNMWEQAQPTATASLFDLEVAADLVPEEVPWPEGPSVDGEGRVEVYTDTFGVFEWAIPLAEHNSAEDTAAALAGWRGDSTVVSSDDEEGPVCVDAVVAFDGASAAASFEAAASSWVAALPAATGATAEADGDRVRLHTCDPGADAEMDVTGEARRNLDELALVNDIATSVAGGAEVSYADALCFARGVIAELGVEAFLDGSDVTVRPDYPDVAGRAAGTCGLVYDGG
jgi:hypothetical protein